MAVTPPSGLQLKLQVHARRSDIVDLFGQYDLGRLDAAQLTASLRALGLYLPATYHLALKKPPLTLARLVHVLTLPDGDRYAHDSPPPPLPPPGEYDHTRQYAIFGDSWDAENSRLRANGAQMMSRDALRRLFKELHLGRTTAADVAAVLVGLGVQVGARRHRLLVNCERGSEHGFRELVVEFQEPFLARDDLPQECHSEAARRATLDAKSRSPSPKKMTRSSSWRRPPHRSEMCTANLIVYGADSPDGSDWERRNQQLAALKRVHLQRTIRSQIVQNVSLVPSVMEPPPRPLQIRSVPDDPLLSTMKVQCDLRPIAVATIRAPAKARRRAPPPPRPELRCPWGSQADVPGADAAGAYARSLSGTARRYQALSLQCCQEMADLDRLVHRPA